MRNPGSEAIEGRIFWLGVGMVGVGSLLVGSLFGLLHAESFLLGGALAAVNFSWFRWSVREVFNQDAKRSKRRILGGFFGRLLLIPLGLYVMMRLLSLSVPAAVAGLTVFHCGVFVEGILEAVESSSK